MFSSPSVSNRRVVNAVGSLTLAAAFAICIFWWRGFTRMTSAISFFLLGLAAFLLWPFIEHGLLHFDPALTGTAIASESAVRWVWLTHLTIIVPDTVPGHYLTIPVFKVLGGIFLVYIPLAGAACEKWFALAAEKRLAEHLTIDKAAANWSFLRSLGIFKRVARRGRA